MLTGDKNVQRMLIMITPVFLLVNKHQLQATNQTHTAAQSWSLVLSDFTSHVATDMPESESHSVNTDVGPDVGYWFPINQNYSADLMRMSVEVASIIGKYRGIPVVPTSTHRTNLRWNCVVHKG